MQRSNEERAARPSVRDYDRASPYLAAMLAWLRQHDRKFSLRAESAKYDLSHSLVSRITTGKRAVTLDRADQLAKLFKLNGGERAALVRLIKDSRSETSRRINSRPAKPQLEPVSSKDGSKTGRGGLLAKRSVNNHLLDNWLNVYVKDSAKLRHFRPDPAFLQKLLGGIASTQAIDKSLRFLLREGFLRWNLARRVLRKVAALC